MSVSVSVNDRSATNAIFLIRHMSGYLQNFHGSQSDGKTSSASSLFVFFKGPGDAETPTPVRNEAGRLSVTAGPQVRQPVNQASDPSTEPMADRGPPSPQPPAAITPRPDSPIGDPAGSQRHLLFTPIKCIAQPPRRHYTGSINRIDSPIEKADQYESVLQGDRLHSVSNGSSIRKKAVEPQSDWTGYRRNSRRLVKCERFLKCHDKQT